MAADRPKGNPHDVWTGPDAYERYVGRWGRPVAREFVSWLGVAAGARWLDIGCGTGAVTSTIVELAQPASVVGVDPSDAFVARAQATLGSPHVTFHVGDGASLPLADGSVDATVAGLVLQFIPDSSAALTEWRRVTRAGGVIGAYVWDYADRMQMIRHFWAAAAAEDPAARALDESVRFPITRREALAGAFEAAGLTAVATRAIDVPTHFADFDDLWQPFLGGSGSAPGYVTTLTEPARAAVRDRLRASLPIAPDGSVDLVARAWAVRGSNP